MPVQTFEITAPNGKTLEVTGDRMPNEAELQDIFAKAGVNTATPSEQPGSNSSLVLAAGKGAAKVPIRALEELATHPGVVTHAQNVGRLTGAAAGAAAGGPVGSAVGTALGHTTGPVVANAVQRAAAPVATVAQKVAPYIQTLGTMSGIQGGLDLAQMAEPDRQDIGFIGIGGSSMPNPAVGQRHRDKAIAEEQSKQEAWDRTKVMVADLMRQGLSKVQALETLLAAKSGAR